MSSPRLPLSARPTFLPEEISRREFATVFRGYDPAEVRTFLKQLAEEAAEIADRVAEIQNVLAKTQQQVKNPELDEETVTRLLGEQTAQVLRSAREAANDIRAKAEEEVSRSLREAHEVTDKMRQQAEALLAERTEEAERMAGSVRSETSEAAEAMRREAEQEAAAIRSQIAAEAHAARQRAEEELQELRRSALAQIDAQREDARRQSTEMVERARQEAYALVERTREKQEDLVGGLVRKRSIALAQVEELRAGRQRLLKAYKLVRGTLDEVTSELGRVEDEARNAARLAGERSAQSSGIAPDDLDTMVDVERIELEDDVSDDIINLTSNSDEKSGEGEGEGEDTESLDESRSSTPAPEGARSGQGTEGEAFEPRAGTTMVEESARVEDADEAIVEVRGAGDDELFAEDHGDSAPHLVIGEAFSMASTEEADAVLKARRETAVRKARFQALRRLRRALQDEQTSVVTRLRSGEANTLSDLMGSRDDHATNFHRAVVRLFREIARSGATSVQGSIAVEKGVVDHAGNQAAKSLSTQLTDDLRAHLEAAMEQLAGGQQALDASSLDALITHCYAAVGGDYLDHLVDDRIRLVFDEGAALAQPR